MMEVPVPRAEAGTDAFARVLLAHSLADVQEDPREELAWDLRALAAMDDLSDERAREREVPGGREGLLPSLHLNLAWDYPKLGDAENAKRHLELGRSYLGSLSDDEYGDAIRQRHVSTPAEN